MLRLAGRTQMSLEEMPRPGQTSGNTQGSEQGGVEPMKTQAREAQGLTLGCGSSFSPRPPQAVFLTRDSYRLETVSRFLGLGRELCPLDGGWVGLGEKG